MNTDIQKRLEKWEKRKEIQKAKKKKFTCPYCSKVYKNKNDVHLLKDAKKNNGKKQGVLTSFVQSRG